MNGGASDVFIDTNILVFATILQAPFHQQARQQTPFITPDEYYSLDQSPGHTRISGSDYPSSDL